MERRDRTMRRKFYSILIVLFMCIMSACSSNTMEKETDKNTQTITEQKSTNGSDEYTKDYSNNSSTNSYTSGKCSLSYCDRSADVGKKYCGTHGCCKDDCNNQKDPSAHCCNTHNCAESGCAAHRYDAVNSKYCKTHYIKHYN